MSFVLQNFGLGHQDTVIIGYIGTMTQSPIDRYQKRAMFGLIVSIKPMLTVTVVTISDDYCMYDIAEIRCSDMVYARKSVSSAIHKFV